MMRFVRFVLLRAFADGLRAGWGPWLTRGQVLAGVR